jgi:Nose resistant-to-fluoxetine protein, N-terminal domain
MLRVLSKPLQVLLALMVCVLVAAVCFQPTVGAFKLGEYAKTVKPGLSKRLASEFTAKKKLLKRELSEEDGDDEYEGEQMSAEAGNSMEGTESQEDDDGFVFRKVSKPTHVIKKRDRSGSNEASEEQDAVKPKSGFFDALKFWKSAESEEEIATAEEEASCTDKPAEQQGYPLFQWLKDYIKRKKSDSGEDDTSAEQPQEPATSSEDKSSFLSSVMDTVNVFKSTVSKAASVVSETASENLKFSLFDEDHEPPPPKPIISYEQFQKLLLQLPSFVPNYTNIFNIDCKRQGQIFERQLRAHKTWTLQLMDANAKLPSGILRGNINQLGDYDQCLGIATKIKVTEDQSIRFRGKYCLAHIELQHKDEDLRAPVSALHGKGALRSNFKDVR